MVTGDAQPKTQGCQNGQRTRVLCRNPGANQGPLDLQSNALPTELFQPVPLSNGLSGREFGVSRPVTFETARAECPREQKRGPYGDRTRDLGVISTTL